MKKKIALVFGGRSAEHEVSLQSARNIYHALDTARFEPVLLGITREGSWHRFADAGVFERMALSDRELGPETSVSLLSYGGRPYALMVQSGEKIPLDGAFPIIHGTLGEDGTLQGYFKILNLPFVGCGVLSSAVGMDKDYMKRLLTAAGLRNARYRLLHRPQNATPETLAALYAELRRELGEVFFIKPANAGSSVGVHKIKSAEDFAVKLGDAFLYDHKVIAEEFISGREIECAVLGPARAARASLPGELVVKHEFYSYEAKYVDQNGAEIRVPAPLDAGQVREVQDLAVRTFEVLGGDGLARVDFFLTPGGDLYVNEINTLPGFTRISMYPKMWEASGLSYRDLITQLIELAFETHTRDNGLKLSF